VPYIANLFGYISYDQANRLLTEGDTRDYVVDAVSITAKRLETYHKRFFSRAERDTDRAYIISVRYILSLLNSRVVLFFLLRIKRCNKIQSRLPSVLRLNSSVV